MKRKKHMTLDDRIKIQECLSKGMTFKAIGERIGKNLTTISREVKIHMEPYTNSFVRTEDVCPKLLKAPFVCTGCEKKSRGSCPYRRQLYTVKKSQAEYDTVLVESRTGIPLNKESFYETERIIQKQYKTGSTSTTSFNQTIYPYRLPQYTVISKRDITQ